MERKVIEVVDGVARHPAYRFIEPVNFVLYENEQLAILGPNGSGKTNFINALSFMKSVVTSELDVQTKIISSINYFLFNKSSKEKPIKFSISFIIDDVLYDYGFSILNNKITSEYLDKKAQRTTHVFTRSGSGFETIKLNTPDFKNVEHVIKNTREDVLFLSWANFCNNEMAMKIYKWFDDIQIFDADDTSQLLSVTVDYMKQNDNGKEEIINLKKAYKRKKKLDILRAKLHFKYNID